MYSFLLFHRLLDHSVWVYFQPFYLFHWLICLFFCASTILFWWLYLCNIVWNQATWFPQVCLSFSILLWLFGVYYDPIQIFRRTMLILWMFGRISCEAIWPMNFMCWGFSNYWFNFSTGDWSVYIFCFLLVQSWEIVYFREFSHFFWTVHFVGVYLLIAVSYKHSHFCGIGYNPFFISDFIDLDPLSLSLSLFLVSLAKSFFFFLIFLSFQRPIFFLDFFFLVPLVFSIVLLFISALKFIISPLY